MQWRCWKGLQAESWHEKGKQKYILVKVKPVVKPEGCVWIAFFSDFIWSTQLSHLGASKKQTVLLLKKIKISKYHLKCWIQKQT